MTDKQHDEHGLDVLLKGAVEDDLPADVEQRLQARLAEFRQRLAGDSVIVTAAKAKVRSKRRLWWSFTGLATCVLIILLRASFYAPAPAWADIVLSVQQRPWICGRAGSTAETKTEFWFSSDSMNRKFASRFGDVEFVSFVNLADRQSFSYRKGEGKIKRRSLPDSALPDLGMAGPLIRAFAPYEELLQQINQDSRLVAQNRQTVTQGGKAWIQFQFIFEEIQGEREQYADTFLIDVDTRLPRWWIRNSPESEKSLRFELTYPDSGPQDIYGLGVPMSVPVIDHNATE